VLTTPKTTNDNTLRVVLPDELKAGSIVYDAFQSKHNPKNERMEMQYDTYNITEVMESRPARGDWSAWDCHPFYNKCVAQYTGLTFESEKQLN